MKTLCQRGNAPPIPSLVSAPVTFSLASTVSGLVPSLSLHVLSRRVALVLLVRRSFCFIFIWIRFDALLLGDASTVEGIISASSTSAHGCRLRRTAEGNFSPSTQTPRFVWLRTGYLPVNATTRRHDATRLQPHSIHPQWYVISKRHHLVLGYPVNRDGAGLRGYACNELPLFP